MIDEEEKGRVVQAGDQWEIYEKLKESGADSDCCGAGVMPVVFL